MAAFVGSIAPACAARFAEGTRPPTIRTFRHVYGFRSLPVRRYLAPVRLSDNVNAPAFVSSSCTQPVKVKARPVVVGVERAGEDARLDWAPTAAAARRIPRAV